MKMALIHDVMRGNWRRRKYIIGRLDPWWMKRKCFSFEGIITILIQHINVSLSRIYLTVWGIIQSLLIIVKVMHLIIIIYTLDSIATCLCKPQTTFPHIQVYHGSVRVRAVDHLCCCYPLKSERKLHDMRAQLCLPCFPTLYKIKREDSENLFFWYCAQ